MDVNAGQAAANQSPDTTLHVAVIGGGIIGAILALGLLQRGIRVTVYERAAEIHETGAAFAFTGVARECMRRLDPHILDALNAVGEKNRHQFNRYWDGFHPTTKEEAQDDSAVLFQVSARELDYCGCLRSHLLHKMAALLPENVIQFRKQLQSYEDNPDRSKVVLHFADGTTAEADAGKLPSYCSPYEEGLILSYASLVVGCDGIHSRTRQLVLGEDHAAARATYSHKVAYRAVVPIDGGVEALGADKANNQCAHLGPDGHTVSFPVSTTSEKIRRGVWRLVDN